MMGSIIEMTKLSSLIREMRIKCGKLPTELQGLGAVKLFSETGKCPPHEALNSLASPIFDKWGNPFVYITDGSKFRILSAGHEWIEITDSSEADLIEKNK